MVLLVCLLGGLASLLLAIQIQLRPSARWAPSCLIPTLMPGLFWAPLLWEALYGTAHEVSLLQTAMAGSGFLVWCLLLVHHQQRRPAEPGTGVPFRERRFAITALFVIAWGWRLYALRNGLLYGTHLAPLLEPNRFANAIAVLNKLGYFATLLSVAANPKSKRSLLLAIAEIVWISGTGSKNAALRVIIPYVFLAACVRRARGLPALRLSARALGKVAVLAVVIAVLYAGVHSFRGRVQSAILAGEDFGGAIVSALTTSSSAPSSPRQTTVADVVERVSLAHPMLRIVEKDRTAHFDRLRGESVLSLLYWPVPRAVWKDKPNLSLGQWYGHHVLGWKFSSRSSANITLWGEEFLNWGFAGLNLIAGLFVVFLVLFERFMGRRFELQYVMACSHMTILLGIQQNLAGVVATVLQTSILAIVMWFLFMRRDRELA